MSEIDREYIVARLGSIAGDLLAAQVKDKHWPYGWLVYEEDARIIAKEIEDLADEVKGG